VAGIFDYDYAPAPDIVDGKRVYMNISQEGRDDLDDLREAGMLYGLKLSSKKYQSTVALRITTIGRDTQTLCTKPYTLNSLPLNPKP
jgi:hypothetical protein